MATHDTEVPGTRLLPRPCRTSSFLALSVLLQSLRDFMLSDQLECLWLTSAMKLLALTLPGVLVLM